VPVCSTVRLTRRGRFVATLTAAALAVALAVLLATSVDAADTRIDHATTVSAGQTLSELAAAQLPGLPIHEAVARIQVANGLNTDQVHAGQSLLIPAMR
jgi:predicted component of type VI protein secretion system